MNYVAYKLIVCNVHVLTIDFNVVQPPLELKYVHVEKTHKNK